MALYSGFPSWYMFTTEILLRLYTTLPIPENEIARLPNSALHLLRAVVRVHVAEDAQARQRRRGALYVVVVDHDLAKHLGRVDVLEEAPPARLFARRIPACICCRVGTWY